MAKAYLLREGLSEAITSVENTHNRMQEKSLADIILICEYNTANYIQAYKTGFKAWKTLKDLYNSDGFISKYLLLQKFYQTLQADFKTVKAYVSKLKSILNNLAAQDLKMLEMANIA